MLISIAGCSDPVKSMYEDYLSRIARVQGESPLPAPDTQFITLPDKQKLRTEIPRVSIGLLESYELRHCGLFELIAERNSSLGKVQDEFRQLDYETRFLFGVKKCLDHPEISQSVRNSLRKAYLQKQQFYPLYFQQVITQSDAWRSQLSGYGWLPTEEPIGLVEVKLALRPFYTIKTYLLNRSIKDPIEESYNLFVTPSQEAIETINIVGSLNFSLLNSTLWLNQITDQLKSFDKKILCGKKIDKTKFTYLKNVFQSQYIERIQPFLSQLDSAYGDLSLELLTILHFTDQKLANFYNIDQNHQRFKIATLNHVRYWQDLFRRCGTVPGTNF